ncbi:uncharacterized protein LOC142982910 [Anticarsia gemmatalis]|uniref:uncharacterized protein LOC142982910 n=1 Tax=Anticarsia gemmatalis TaxID=129554 RepID=UPI003F76B4B5
MKPISPIAPLELERPLPPEPIPPKPPEIEPHIFEKPAFLPTKPIPHSPKISPSSIPNPNPSVTTTKHIEPGYPNYGSYLYSIPGFSAFQPVNHSGMAGYHPGLLPPTQPLQPDTVAPDFPFQHPSLLHSSKDPILDESSMESDALHVVEESEPPTDFEDHFTPEIISTVSSVSTPEVSKAQPTESKMSITSLAQGSGATVTIPSIPPSKEIKKKPERFSLKTSIPISKIDMKCVSTPPDSLFQNSLTKKPFNPVFTKDPPRVEIQSNIVIKSATKETEIKDTVKPVIPVTSSINTLINNTDALKKTDNKFRIPDPPKSDPPAETKTTPALTKPLFNPMNIETNKVKVNKPPERETFTNDAKNQILFIQNKNNNNQNPKMLLTIQQQNPQVLLQRTNFESKNSQAPSRLLNQSKKCKDDVVNEGTSSKVVALKRLHQENCDENDFENLITENQIYGNKIVVKEKSQGTQQEQDLKNKKTVTEKLTTTEPKSVVLQPNFLYLSNVQFPANMMIVKNNSKVTQTPDNNKAKLTTNENKIVNEVNVVTSTAEVNVNINNKAVKSAPVTVVNKEIQILKTTNNVIQPLQSKAKVDIVIPKPDSGLSMPEIVISRSDPVLSMPEIVISKSDPVLNMPEIVISKSDPVLSMPEIVISRSDPVLSMPEIVINKPDAVISIPEIVMSKPDIVMSKPEMIFTKPEIVFSKPEIVMTRQEMVFTKPEIIIKKPEVIINTPENIVITQPEIEIRNPVIQSERGQVIVNQVPQFLYQVPLSTIVEAEKITVPKVVNIEPEKIAQTIPPKIVAPKKETPKKETPKPVKTNDKIVIACPKDSKLQPQIVITSLRHNKPAAITKPEEMSSLDIYEKRKRLRRLKYLSNRDHHPLKEAKQDARQQASSAPVKKVDKNDPSSNIITPEQIKSEIYKEMAIAKGKVDEESSESDSDDSEAELKQYKAIIKEYGRTKGSRKKKSRKRKAEFLANFNLASQEAFKEKDLDLQDRMLKHDRVRRAYAAVGRLDVLLNGQEKAPSPAPEPLRAKISIFAEENCETIRKKSKFLSVFKLTQVTQKYKESYEYAWDTILKERQRRDSNTDENATVTWPSFYLHTRGQLQLMTEIKQSVNENNNLIKKMLDREEQPGESISVLAEKNFSELNRLSKMADRSLKLVSGQNTRKRDLNPGFDSENIQTVQVEQPFYDYPKLNIPDISNIISLKSPQECERGVTTQATSMDEPQSCAAGVQETVVEAPPMPDKSEDAWCQVNEPFWPGVDLLIKSYKDYDIGRRREIADLHRRNTSLRVEGAHITRSASRDSDRALALLAERQNLAVEESNLRLSLVKLRAAIDEVKNFTGEHDFC